MNDFFKEDFQKFFREHACTKRGGAERERIPSRLSAVSAEPDTGLDPTNCEIMTLAKIKSWTLSWLSHPGASI